MAKATEDKSAIPITVQFRPQQVDFIEAAAKKAGKSRTVFLRELDLAGAAKVMGAEPPDAEPFDMGAQSAISRAAKQAGVPVRVFLREMTERALQKGIGLDGARPISTKERIARRKAAASKKNGKK